MTQETLPSLLREPEALPVRTTPCPPSSRLRVPEPAWPLPSQDTGPRERALAWSHDFPGPFPFLSSPPASFGSKAAFSEGV